MTKTEPKISLNIRSPNSDEKAEAIAKAAAKKRAHSETIDEAWARICGMKNSDADKRRLAEVKQAMDAGKIGREAESASKRFSKAEALRLWRVLDERRAEERLRKMVEETPDNYWLITDEAKLEEFLEILKNEKEIVFDVETTGANVWEDQLVGHVLTAVNADIHAYIPTKHIDNKPELDHGFVIAKFNPIYEDDSICQNEHK